MIAKINTPDEMPKTRVLEQRADYLKVRSEYSNGLIIIQEATPEKVHVHSNFKWIPESDGSLTPNYNVKNLDFIDE